MPYLFVRSYVYVVFINIASATKEDLFGEVQLEVNTKSFKIWYFNSKYEIKLTMRKTNLFGIALTDDESIDDYMYLVNSDTELKRMRAANSDAIDCIRAFTGNLTLMQQTNEMLNEVRHELDTNPRARVLVEGPARSGKTIIAAALLGINKNSKFLLMNYFFYKALVDGFHALSGWSKDEIEALVSNPELDVLIKLKGLLKNPKNLQNHFNTIKKNLPYAIKECDFPLANSNTQKWLLTNLSKVVSDVADSGVNLRSLPIFNLMIKIKHVLEDDKTGVPFASIERELVMLQQQLKFITDENVNTEGILKLQSQISMLISEIMANSKQKFFHHNINPKNKSGCWITRGNPTASNMWSDDCKVDLIICDEVQRLGLINKFHNYDEFNEIEQIIENSKQCFFTGDDFQMLNKGYDQGIQKIQEILKNRNEHLIRYELPESVGVPAEVGLLMKGLTHPDAIVDIQEIVVNWDEEKEFEIIFIDNNNNKLVELFDDDTSIKKHFAIPMDNLWLNAKNESIKIQSTSRAKDIIPLIFHEKKDFAYSFPYFCNEEVMPNYSLSAYELISREVESLYIYIPNFSFLENSNENSDIETWFRKHLYVLYTRPTLKLVVDIASESLLNQTKAIIDILNSNGAKIKVSYF